MRSVKYGMIGFGGIAENRIAKEGFACDRKRFIPLSDVKLVGATDLNPARREAAESLGLKWYADTAAMLADPEIEAVFVATNNTTHAEMAAQSLRAGRHVLVEKPMASNSAAARELTALAKTKRLSLAVDHMMTENSWNHAARKVIADGSLGTVNDSCFHMEFSYGSTLEEAATWRCARPEELGGPIGDVASHCLYMAEFMFDSHVTEIACVYYPKQMNIVVEDGAYLKFKLASGMTGSVRVSFSDPRGGLKTTLDNLGYEIYGTSGVLRAHGTLFQLSGHSDEPIKIRLEVERFQERYDVPVGRIVNIYQEVIRRHALSIREERPMSGLDGLRNLLLIEAAHESACNNGKTIKIKD